MQHLQPTAGDGIRHYGSPRPLRVVRTTTVFGHENDEISVKIVLLLPGIIPEVVPGDLIKLNGQSFEIHSVEQCRSVAGEIIAFKCTIK